MVGSPLALSVPWVQWHMTARIGNYVGLIPTTASVEFPFVGNSALHDGFPFIGNSTCSSDKRLLVRNQICSSGEIMSVGNFTRDSDQILRCHDFVENDPSPSQSEIALVLHEITKTRECMNAVFDHLDDLCDRLGAFYEKRERDHRVNKDVAISKSTLPTCSFIESMESNYRQLRVNGQHGWRRTLCFHYKAHGHFACECPNLPARSGADMDFNRRHSMKSRNRHGSVNDKQRAGIDLNSMIWRNLRDFDFNAMIKRNLRDFVNDMENFNGTLVVPRDANLYNVGEEQNGIDLNSMIRRNLRDFDLNSMITRNLCDFVNDMESFNGHLVVARDANFDNMGGQQNDLVPDIDDDLAIPWVGINADEFIQTLQNVPDVCQQASFANDEMICDNVHNDITSTREMVSLGFGHQNTSCLDDVNCDALHDYDIGTNLAQMLNLYQRGSYEMKCDERFISFDSDVNRISSERRYAGNMPLISTCSYTENVGFTKDFDNFRGCQTDINIFHLTTGTYEFHLHFGHDNSSELQLYEVWGVVKRFRNKEIRHRKEIYQSNSRDCSTTVSSLCEWPCWTLGLLVYVSVNELTQFHGNFSFVENTHRLIWGLFDCQQSDIIFSVYWVLW